MIFINTIHTHTHTHNCDAREIRQEIELIDKNHVRLHYKRLYFDLEKLPKNQFIRFVDSDDILTKDAILKCVNDLHFDNEIELVWDGIGTFFDGLEYNPAMTANGVFVGNFNLFGKRVIDGIGLINMAMMPWVVHGIFKSDILQRGHIGFVEGIECEDHIFGFQVLTSARKIILCDNLGYLYRIRPDSTCGYGRQKDVALPSHLDDLRKHFKNNMQTKLYFHAYCFACIVNFIYDRRFYFHKSHRLRHFIATYGRRTLICEKFNKDPLDSLKLLKDIFTFIDAQDVTYSMWLYHPARMRFLSKIKKYINKIIPRSFIVKLLKFIGLYNFARLIKRGLIKMIRIAIKFRR